MAGYAQLKPRNRHFPRGFTNPLFATLIIELPNAGLLYISVISAPADLIARGPHVGPMDLAIWEVRLFSPIFIHDL